MQHQTDTFARLAWEADGSPRSLAFDDPYFAREDGRAETRHVFIAANGLPGRWQLRDTFTIAELGFGTGLNFLETMAEWQRAPKPAQEPAMGLCRHLTFVSFERYPLTGADIARALAPWPDLCPNIEVLLAAWPPPGPTGCHTVQFANATLELHLGDANDTLPAWSGAADAWYLDGFSPAKNPDLWSQELMSEVHRHTVPGGTFATYTAAGFVRRNLIAAGFEVAKIPGYGRKRESLAGHRP